MKYVIYVEDIKSYYAENGYFTQEISEASAYSKYNIFRFYYKFKLSRYYHKVTLKKIIVVNKVKF